jgi:RNA polymerase sigma factor (sigma-70 family)
VCRRTGRLLSLRSNDAERLRNLPQSIHGSPTYQFNVRTSHHAGLSDDALVAGLAIEDADAATAFVRRFQAKVFGMALSVTHDQALADDVAQESFLRAWRSAATYDGLRGSVSAWLLTITRNAAIDAVRARRSVPADHDALDRLLQATLGRAEPSDATGESATTSVEAGHALARLRSLPADQARSVVLAVFGGCTAQEISERDGVPIGTAKTRIRTGLRRLRQERTDQVEHRPSKHLEGRGG